MQNFKAKKIITIAVAALIFLVGYHFLRINYLSREIGMVRGSFFFYVLFWEVTVFLFAFRILTKRKHKLGLSFAIPAMLIIPVLSLLVSEACWDNAIGNIHIPAIIINISVYFLLELGFLFIFSSFNAAFIATVVVSFLLGTINHYVGDFRGDCFKASDILVSQTAAKVADQYKFTLSDGLLKGLAVLLVVILLASFFSFPKAEGIKKRAVLAVCGLVVIAADCLLFYYMPVFDALGYEIYPFLPQESYAEYGVTSGFIMTAQDSRIKKPKGYNEKEVEAVLGAFEDNTDIIDDTPTVIAIMNEAFSDLSILGDFEAEDYMADWYGISDYAMRGYVYVPVNGGGTANSEFEFLTGLAMAGLNPGVYPYQQYDLQNAHSISHDFERFGGDTISFHPYTASNYNRINVYKNFGFNNFYSKKDMDDISTISWGVSDESDYNKLIELYENSDKPAFLFNVTMQNHSSYKEPESLKIDSYVSVGDDYSQYRNTISYLTLVRESCSAIKNLTDYFRNKDEKVVIVMFGDHQPALLDGFLEAIYENDGSLEAGARRYMTPYMVWANYDLDADQVEKNFSLNYLAANVYDLLGIKTQYTEYLLDLEKDYPVIGVSGYQDASGNWHSYEEKNEKLDEYFRVEYHELTGK